MVDSRLVNQNTIQGSSIDLFFNNGNGRSAFNPGASNFPSKYDTNKDLHATFMYSSYSINPRVISGNDFSNNFGIPLNFTGYNAVSKGTADGYLMEGRISWKVINTEFVDAITEQYTDLTKKPASTRIPFGFDMAVNIPDASLTERGSQLMWNQCCWNTNWSQSQHFGYLKLAGYPQLFTATGINISEKNNGALAITSPNTQLDLKAAIDPTDAPQNVSWSVEGISGGFDIAQIDEFGRLTPLNNGIVTVTAATFPITVTDGSIYTPTIPNGTIIPSVTSTTTVTISGQVTPTAVSISAPSISQNWGNSIPSVSVVPSNASNLVSWSLLDPLGLAKMNTLTGEVTATAMGNGTVTIVGTSLVNGVVGNYTLPITQQEPITCFALNAFTNINQNARTKNNLTFSGFNSGAGSLKTKINLVSQYINRYELTATGMSSHIPNDLVSITGRFAPSTSGQIQKTGAGWEISFNQTAANPVTITAVYLNDPSKTTQVICAVRAAGATTGGTGCDWDIRNFDNHPTKAGCNPQITFSGMTECNTLGGVSNLSAQTITYTAVPTKTISDIPFNLQASASSGLAVSFAVLSGPATVIGNQVTLNGTSGMVMIRASQTGNGSFMAAPNVDFSFAVSSPTLQNQTITFADISAKVTTDAPFNLSATASSNLPITYTLVQGPATLLNNQITLNGNSGIIIVKATQAGNSAFNPATSVEKFILVNNASLSNQTITFPTIANQMSNASFSLSATASSNLAITYEVVSGPANVSGNTVNLTSGFGDVTIRASQTGNGSFNPAQFIERTFNVCESVGATSITISNSGSSTFCLPLATTLTSSLNYPVMAWSNGSTNPSIAVQTSGLYTLTVGSGLCKVVSNSLQITAKSPIITPICMVTLDEATGKNKVVFEKPVGFVTSITSWRIYRESAVANEYLLKNTLNISSLSEYVDATSTPTAQAYRYKLETTDNICNTANLSAAHKTMHLTINKGQNNTTWNLIWTEYEGMPLATYNIYRGTSATNLTFLKEVAGNLTSFTDATAPAVSSIFYQIELVTSKNCNPTARTEAYSSVKSNVAETVSTNLATYQSTSFKISPNPYNNGELRIENGDSATSKQNELQIYNAQGSVVYNSISVSETTLLNLNLTKGIYLVKVGNNSQKLVVE